MKAWNGMINNYEDINTIKAEGKATNWIENKMDRDGMEYEEVVNGYEYEGKRYIITIDRDGWPIAWER